MRRALRLAEKARGWTLPNPMVGAVLVKDGERIGEGYHAEFGGDHAEIMALKNCETSAKGATLYVTLEPCAHEGKTGPCAQAIIEAGISKVVIASTDPNPNSKDGVQELRDAGIEVEVGLLEEAARDLNKDFFCFHEKARPYVTLKIASTLDAKVAEKRGVQTWLTGKKAQKYVHLLRARHQAVLVGAGTALTDDPHLGVRLVEGRDPLRIIARGERELRDDLQIFRDDNHWIYDVKNMDDFLNSCKEKGIVSVLVEGGPRVFSCFFKNKSFDELHYIQAPRLLGSDALSFNEDPSDISLHLESVQKLGQDVLTISTPQWD